MRSSRVFALCIVLLYVAICQGQSKFKANFQAQEISTDDGSVIRNYGGVFYYEDTWTAANPTGRQAMRFDISLNDGTTSRTLTQLYVFQDQFFKYTICGGKCAWQDLFAEEPLPKLYINNETPSGSATTINGVAVTPYTLSQTNAININYAGFVKLWVRNTNPRFAVRAEIKYDSIGVLQRIDFTSQEASFSSAIFNVPAGCPTIEPGCFRVDLSLVLDISGSVGNTGVTQGVQFVHDLVSRFLIGPKNVQVAFAKFSWCRSANQLFPMISDKPTLLARINNLLSGTNILRTDGGFTCIVGGVREGFNNWNAANGGRPSTRKALIIITDGNGNRPCSTTYIGDSPSEDCQGWNQAVVNQVAPICGTRSSSRCDSSLCCQALHDWQLGRYYTDNYNKDKPTIYAVGVGTSSSISDATLRLIVNDPQAIARGDPRVFRANSYASLNSIIVALAKAILCDVEGSETCPNDCRPGGFCCAGGCLCSVDCSISSTECQAGVCKVDSTGAKCVLGLPDNSSCQDPRVQCNDRFCRENEGCIGIPNNEKPCTDFNACTDDRCEGGVCVSELNATVVNCDDHNGCTVNDACVSDGICKGTADDTTGNCTDGNACTSDSCFNGTCIAVPNIACVDTNTADCLYPICDPITGLCAPVPIEPGFECAPRDPRDNCTVYICDRFDPEDYIKCIANGNGERCNTGECKKATRDLDECGSSEINTAGIIGGVIAGVAFLAIIALIILIVILFLLRKKVVDVLGSLNPFGKDVFVHDNPAHVNPTTTHTVPDLT